MTQRGEADDARPTPAIRATLMPRLRAGDARVGVVGLGYVGLPLLLRFSEVGLSVVGFDSDPAKVEALRLGRSYIRHIAGDRVARMLAAGATFTGDLAAVAELDAIIICVPTPLTRHREPDLSFVIDTVESIAPHLRPGQLVSLESTTYPGTTEEELAPRIEARGLCVGRDIALVYSPEREDPGNPTYSTGNIPKLVGGVSPDCLQAGLALYGRVVEQVVPVSSPRTAEMAKLLENIHRAVNIGLVNEMKIVADRMGVDIHEVIAAAATKPFGFVAYRPGPGLGGHCIPIDPFYLTWKAREYGVNTRFIELAGEVNSAMPQWVLGKIADALNQDGRAFRGSRVLVLGIAYKKNVDDTRESPSVALMELLRERGAEVHYSDPWVPEFPRMRRHHFDLCSVALSAESLASYDCVVIGTDHEAFDWALIRQHARRIVDTRGVYREADPRIIKA